MGAVETRLLLCPDRFLDNGRGFFYCFGRSVVRQAELKDDAPLLQALVVLDGAADHAGIGHDDLLTAQTADARGLQPDLLDGAGQCADDDEVAHLERLVHGNRQRGEQVAEDVLHGKRNGNAAHAKAGDEGGDVHAQVRQHGQQYHRPQQHPCAPPRQGGQGAALVQACGAVPGEVAVKAQADGTIDPQADLQRRHHEPEAAHPAQPALGQVEHAQAHQHRGKEQQEVAGAGQHFGHYLAQCAVMLGPALHPPEQKTDGRPGGQEGQCGDSQRQQQVEDGNTEHGGVGEKFDDAIVHERLASWLPLSEFARAVHRTPTGRERSIGFWFFLGVCIP
ncbi:hypothetical protein D3C81_1030920 [compost metagenome]